MDANSLNTVSVVAPGGGNYSFRLGDAINGGTASGLPQAEAIRLSFLVTPSNAGFTYRYAAFLQYAGHPAEMQPRFEIVPFDSSNNIIPCGYLKVVSGTTMGCPGTATYHPGAGFGVDQWYYTNWTSVGLDLTSYMGQNVSVEFRTSDCFGGGALPSSADISPGVATMVAVNPATAPRR